MAWYKCISTVRVWKQRKWGSIDGEAEKSVSLSLSLSLGVHDKAKDDDAFFRGYGCLCVCTYSFVRHSARLLLLVLPRRLANLRGTGSWVREKQTDRTEPGGGDDMYGAFTFCRSR